tara:strand:- start:1815 stop:2282 length:468 start_codon:yes stop_codon:yes gene_type:complete
MNSNFNIILFRPEIPSNTGNIIRLCSNTNSNLFIIEPINFKLDHKSLIRAGLDYHDQVNILKFIDIRSCLKKIGETNLYLITKFGKKKYSDFNYKKGDSFLFGSESNGIKDLALSKQFYKEKVFIPMASGNRSLNLSNSVSICIYEALKQNRFEF